MPLRWGNVLGQQSPARAGALVAAGALALVLYAGVYSRACTSVESWSPATGGRSGGSLVAEGSSAYRGLEHRRGCLGLTNYPPREGLDTQDLYAQARWSKRRYFELLERRYGYRSGVQYANTGRNPLLPQARGGAKLLRVGCLESAGIKFVLFIGDSTVRGVSWGFHRALISPPDVDKAAGRGGAYRARGQVGAPRGGDAPQLWASGAHEPPPGDIEEDVCTKSGLSYTFIQMDFLSREELSRTLDEYRDLGCRGLVWLGGGLHNLAFQRPFYSDSGFRVPTAAEWIGVRSDVGLKDPERVAHDAFARYYNGLADVNSSSAVRERVRALQTSLESYWDSYKSGAGIKARDWVKKLFTHLSTLIESPRLVDAAPAYPFDRYEHSRHLARDLAELGGADFRFVFASTPSVDAVLYNMNPSGPFTRLGLPHFTDTQIVHAWAVADRKAFGRSRNVTFVDGFEASLHFSGLRCDGIHYSHDGDTVDSDYRWGCDGFSVIDDLLVQNALNQVCLEVSPAFGCAQL